MAANIKTLSNRFVGDPVEIAGRAFEDRQGEDLGRFVGMDLKNRLFGLFVDVGAGLHDTAPFLPLGNLAFPAIDAGDGALDLDTGGQLGGDDRLADLYRFFFAGSGRDDLDVLWLGHGD